jgi:hypothetical protein
MIYELAFKKSALKEWKKLGPNVRELFTKKLKERLSNPHVPSAAVNGGTNLYKKNAPARISLGLLSIRYHSYGNSCRSRQKKPK